MHSDKKNQNSNSQSGGIKKEREKLPKFSKSIHNKAYFRLVFCPLIMY